AGDGNTVRSIQGGAALQRDGEELHHIPLRRGRQGVVEQRAGGGHLQHPHGGGGYIWRGLRRSGGRAEQFREPVVHGAQLPDNLLVWSARIFAAGVSARLRRILPGRGERSPRRRHVGGGGAAFGHSHAHPALLPDRQ